MDKTYYEILDVSNEATLKEIQDAVNRLKYGNESERTEISEWDKIDEAYKVLSDPLLRQDYDKKILEKLEEDKSTIKYSLNEVNIVKRIKNAKLYNNIGKEIRANINSKYRLALESSIKKSLNDEIKLNELKNKYVKYIELLKKEIAVKENRIIRKGEKIIYNLELAALNNELDRSLGNVSATK